MIDLKNISKTYKGMGQPVTAVSDTSLSIAGGEFVSIMGHSGSGKSTLLSIIGGILRPDTGAVIVEGKDLWSQSDNERAHLRNAASIDACRA